MKVHLFTLTIQTRSACKQRVYVFLQANNVLTRQSASGKWSPLINLIFSGKVLTALPHLTLQLESLAHYCIQSASVVAIY